MRMQRKFLGVQQVSGKKKTALLKGKGGGGRGCDRTLLVRTYKATLMDVDYQTDRPFSAIKIKFAGEKSDIFIIFIHNIVGGYSLEPP